MKKINVSEIKNSQFLGKLNNNELKNLSTDIRNYIIECVSETGGHLSSNLGIVDLTVALHKNFNFEKDKIIFDVSHQCYTHKILSGRASKMKTLRQYKGLSGFQNLSEGDDYEAGHSSTSLSTALGYAVARDLSKQKHNVVAIIGDGSIGNGMAYEALNHIGATDTNIVVVLNDNEMSIAENVGAFHNMLDKIRLNKKYNDLKDDTKNVFMKIPAIGKNIVNSITNIKASIKNMYIKEGIIFEELGFKYFGPINGHDYEELNLYLKLAKKTKGPVLLHVITEKGKGYFHAQCDKNGAWHGVAPFDISTGKSKSKSDERVIWSEVISDKVLELSKNDKDIITITPAMSTGSKLNKIKKELPKQFIDVGIAEEHALTFGNALALAGKKPFISIYSSFLQRGYDQLIHDIAKMNKGVVIGVDRCGIIGEDGASHQGLYDLSFSLPIPNLIITQPKDAKEANSLLDLAFKLNKPFLIRYSKNKLVPNSESEKITIGTWEVVKKGKDATIITYGDFVGKAVKISEILKNKNINIEVVNARFLKPIDTDMFNKICKKNKPIIVYEENVEIGSLGSYLSLNNKAKITTIGVKDEFIEHGAKDIIIKSLDLDEESVSKKIVNIIKQDCK